LRNQENIIDEHESPETIAIEKPGKYNIDLKGLLEKEPIIIQKDGTYVIHLPSVFKMIDKYVIHLPSVFKMIDKKE